MSDKLIEHNIFPLLMETASSVMHSIVRVHRQRAIEGIELFSTPMAIFTGQMTDQTLNNYFIT